MIRTITTPIIRLLCLCLSLLVLAGCSNGEESSTEMDQQTALERIENKSITVIDVRTPEEFAAGHVPSAINIPHDQLDQHKDTLAKLEQKPVLLYCKSGYRAGIAHDKLAELGFTQLHHLSGDMQEWAGNQRPIEK